MMIKKIILAALMSVSLSAADNDLYDNSVSLNIGYGSTGATATTYSGAIYGLQINRNLNTSEGAWNIDALQFAVDYANLNSTGREYAVRVGSNALWYIENNSDWTPFFKLGVGLQFFSGTAAIDAGNYFFGTLGAGMELQLRGDTSLVGELTDHISATGENSLRLAVGVKYSFGQSY
jgi:hypothetical protein